MSPVKFSAAVRIFGIGLDLDSISRMLGLRPSHRHKAGDPDRLGDPYSADLWSLNSPLSRNDDLAKHLLWLRNTLEPHYAFLRSLKKNHQIRSFCGIVADDVTCRFRLSSDALRLFTELDMSFEASLILLGYPPDLSGEPIRTKDDGTMDQTGQGRYLRKSEVYFELHSDNADARTLSALLKVEPSEFCLDSEPERQGRCSTPGGVSLFSVSPESDLSDQVLRLKGFLQRNADVIRTLKSTSDILIRCRFDTSSDNSGFEISANALELPVGLGLSLQFEARLL